MTELHSAQQTLASLSYAIGHDLRAPVRAITGFTEALQQRTAGKLDADADHYLQRINEATQRLNSMLTGLAKLAELAEPKLRLAPVDITALCQSLVTELAVRYEQWQPRITIAADLHAMADAVLLRMALDELLSNAWKYSSSRGDAHIDISGTQQAGELRLCIRDNGVGFDLRQARHLFAPFQHYTEASSLDGLGLGLARVQLIVQRHQGRTWAETSPQQGAAFYCTLPLKI